MAAARIGTLILPLLNLAAAIIALIGLVSPNWVEALLSAVIAWYLMQGRIYQAFE